MSQRKVYAAVRTEKNAPEILESLLIEKVII